MISKLLKPRCSPIGVDIGSRSVKLVQLSADHQNLIDAACVQRHDGSSEVPSDEISKDRLADAMTKARDGRSFRGRDAVICLNSQQLFLQNVRVPKAEGAALERTIQQEAAGRIPFPVAEAEIRYLEAADIRHGEALMREVILMACHRPVLEASIATVERAGLRPVAVDVEPAALLRSNGLQFRRDQDRDQRSMLVQIGHSATAVVIAQGDEVLFIKYIELGGQHLDEAVAQQLHMQTADASALRRHNGDRRSDRQDPEIARGVSEAIRPSIERLCNELSMCVRYHSVTFRGRPLSRMVLSGGEANQQLSESLGKRVGLKAVLSDPLRGYPTRANSGRQGMWDVAIGLALRQQN